MVLYRFDMRTIVVLVLCSLGILKVIAQEEKREYVPFVEEADHGVGSNRSRGRF